MDRATKEREGEFRVGNQMKKTLGDRRIRTGNKNGTAGISTSRVVVFFVNSSAKSKNAVKSMKGAEVFEFVIFEKGKHLLVKVLRGVTEDTEGGSLVERVRGSAAKDGGRDTDDDADASVRFRVA